MDGLDSNRRYMTKKVNKAFNLGINITAAASKLSVCKYRERNQLKYPIRMGSVVLDKKVAILTV